jgi:hypothetical protein
MNLYEVTALVEWPGQGVVTEVREEMAVSKMDAVYQLFDKIRDEGGEMKAMPTVKYLDTVGAR